MALRLAAAQELRIECFYPVDAATERHARALRTQR